MPVGCHLIDVIPGLKVEDPTAKQQYCYCCKLRYVPAVKLICKRNNPTVRTKLREMHSVCYLFCFLMRCVPISRIRKYIDRQKTPD